MVLQVEDFNTSLGLSVDDFEEDPTIRTPLNKRTASQLAAGQTVLSSGDTKEYEDIKTELLDPDRKANFTLRHEQMRKALWEDSQRGLTDLLADQSLDDETKMNIVKGIDGGFNTTSITSSTLDILAEESLVADSGEHETARSAEGRNLFLETVQSSNAHKKKMTEIINGLNLDQGSVGQLVDVAELFAPFAEWIHFARMLKSVKGESATNLMGQQKAELFEHIKGMPLEERAAVAQSIVDIVRGSDTVVLPDGNDVIALETLENMLVGNDYSDFERYFDNVTSVLEVIGVGALVRSVVKGRKVAKAGSKLQQEAKEFSPAQEVTDEALAAEAGSFKAAPEATDEALSAEAGGFKSPTAAEDQAAGAALGRDDFVPQAEPTVGSVFTEAMVHATHTDVTPTSPSQIVKDTNPGIARQMHKMVEDDLSGESAQALGGASREEVLAKNTLPEPEAKKGSLPNKVEMYKNLPDEPEDIKRLRTREGNSITSDKEIGVIRTRVSEGLNEIEGMVMHPSSLVTRVNPDETVGFTARYSPTDSGFSTPQEALDQAEVAFRTYGIGPENFTILARRGDQWVEADIKDLNAEIALKEAGADGFDSVDYAIGMKYDYRFDPDDLDLLGMEFENLTTAPGWIARGVQALSRIDRGFLSGLSQGSLEQHLLDASSTIHPQIVAAASVAVDRALSIKKLYVDKFVEFTKDYTKLDKKRKALMSDYIHQANLEGIKFDVADLAARGFNEDEIAALKKWRRANDLMWHAANADMLKSLINKGLKVFTHKGSDTTLMGRPMKRGEGGKYVFDPVSNSVVRKSSEELDELYANNGELLKLDEPIEIDGRMVDKVYSLNTPSGGFVRSFREGEKVLSYRDGYYPVMYDANHFIYKRLKDGAKKTFAAAKSRKEVDEVLKGIQRSEKLSDKEMEQMYGFRLDRNIESPNQSIFDEGAWNVATNAGLSSQRLRGQRLKEAGADLQGMGKNHIKDPLDAVATQIQHLSQRVAMRDFMATARKRWMKQYGRYLDLPVNPKTGQTEIPSKVSSIKGKDGVPSDIVSAAKSNFNYLNTLENGYINGMDQLYRGAMHLAADLFAKVGSGLGERAAFAAMKKSPTQTAKTAAFKLFIAGNPARQAVIQRGQMLLINVHNPGYSLSKMLPDLAGIDMVRAGLSKDPKYVKLFDEVKDSGLLEAVDAHNFIRDDLLKMADLGTQGTVKTVLGAPLKYAQKWGFDSAEQDVLLSAWLSARDKAIKAGKDVKSQRVKDQILGEARAFTLNMNRAGEMPYSQNTLGLMAQFLSFQHKALLQPLTNRSLSKKDRVKMLAYSAAVWGIDATAIGVIVDQLMGDEPSETKDVVKNGLLDAGLNAALSAISGEAQAIDFGDLAPTEAYTFGNLLFSILETPLAEALTSSPSGSLLFGANPRITDAFKTGVRWFVPFTDYDDPVLETNYKDVAMSAMNLFSGFSNTFKANYAFNSGQKLSGTGRVTDEDVTSVEAAATLFGFRTKQEEGSRKVKELIYENSSYTPGDVDSWYSELKRHLARRYDTVAERDLAQRVLSEAWLVFGEERPRVLETIVSKLEKDAQVGDFKIVQGLISDMGLNTDDEVWEIINKHPAGPQRDFLTELMKQRNGDENGS